MAAGDYRTVDAFEVSLGVIITEYDMDDGTKVYDWKTDGQDSDEWFHSIEEARRDVRNHFEG